MLVLVIKLILKKSNMKKLTHITSLLRILCIRELYKIYTVMYVNVSFYKIYCNLEKFLNTCTCIVVDINLLEWVGSNRRRKKEDYD